MTYYDQHLHTHHSYDSQADFTDYLDNSTGFVVTTEHFDVANPVTGQTDVPDYWAYSAEIEQLNIQYGNRILKGIEIGYLVPICQLIVTQPLMNRDHERTERNPGLSDRSQTAASPDDPLLVLEQGNLPARTHLQCIGRRRQIAF